jgi:hypothetical protein
MNPRERNMLIAFMAVVLVGGGGFAGYTFVYSPLEEANTAIKQLRDEIDDTADKQGLQSRVDTMRTAVKQLKQAKRESLPPNVDLAKAQYVRLLERLLQESLQDPRIKNYRIPEPKTVERRPPVTPEITAKKPAYSVLEFRVELDKVNMWEVSDFLSKFYQLDLLHQITDMNITRENKTTETRSGLRVHFTIEAIIVDGAEPRTSLFPVQLSSGVTPLGELVQAVGGGLAVQAIASHPELDRKLTRPPTTRVLATRTRDYSLLPYNDIFYGVVPPDRAPREYTAPPKDDISAYIRLTTLSESSEGTMSAYIMDIATPCKYNITFDPKNGIQVVRLYHKKKQVWSPDLDYDHPQGVLMVSDDESSTKRTLKVIAIEANAIVVEDLSKPQDRADARPGGNRGPGGGGNRGPGAGGNRGPGGPGGGGNRGPGAGGAAAAPKGGAPAPKAGAPAGAAPVDAVAADVAPEPVLYRWVIGKSLKELDQAKIPTDEARKILSRAVLAQKPAGESPVSAKPE